MHIRSKFTYFKDDQETLDCVKNWREVMKDAIDKKYHYKIM